MFFFCFAPFVLLIHLSKETNADGAVNEACNAGACTDTENTVCDTVTSKCLYKAAKACTVNESYCVTGAACPSIASPCECGETYIATSTGLCALVVDQSCTALGTPCLDNGECSSPTCQCKTGYTPSADKTTCTLVVDQLCTALGTPCLDNGECSSSTCQCKTGYTPSADKTTCRVDVLQSCAAPNADNCKTGLACDTTDSKCRYKARSTCTTGVDRCVSGATCASVSAQCTCNTAAYTANDVTGICEANAKKVGGSCTAGAGACDDSNASCTNSKCVCNAGYQVKLADATCSGAMGLVASTFLLFASFLVKAQF